MTGGQAYTAKEIAEIMGKSKQAIQKRAKKESWQYVTGNGKGGDHAKYALPALRAEIQRIEEEINLKQADKRRRLVFLKEMEGTR